MSRPGPGLGGILDDPARPGADRSLVQAIGGGAQVHGLDAAEGTARYLAADEVLVDSMRGRFSTWARIRVNLRSCRRRFGPCRRRRIRMMIRPGKSIGAFMLNPARVARRMVDVLR
jgi:hypothetical protein